MVFEMHGSTTLRSIKITDLLLILLLVSSAAAKLSEAQCNVVCNPDNEDCDGFLSSLPLRTGPQILTTALVTGLLGKPVFGHLSITTAFRGSSL